MCQLSIYNSFPVIRTTKITHPGLHFFVRPGDAPAAITQNVAWMKRQFSACQTPLGMYPSIFNSFPVIQTASAKKSQFSRTAAHIFVSRGDAPATIMQFVASMERQFNACQTPRSSDKYYLFYALFDAPVRGFPSEYRHPLWYGKTRMVWLPDGEKISKICLFVLTWSTNVTDGRTDRLRTLHDSKDRACIASRGKNHPILMKFCTHQHILNWINVTWSKMKKLHWTDSEFDRT